MSVFGVNILEMALGAIPPSKMEWRAYNGEVVSPTYIDQPSYAPAVVLYGSIQRIATDTYKDLGLSMEKKYRKVFVSANVRGVNEIKSPDILSFSGKNWVVLKDTSDWLDYDGWRAFIVVLQEQFK